jgi:alcohol dehydrogenase class IV
MGENLEGLSLREGDECTLAAMRSLAADLQVPQYLSDVGIAEAAIEDLADGAMTQTRLLANKPRKLTRDDIVQIYKNAALQPGAKPVKEKKAAPGK